MSIFGKIKTAIFGHGGGPLGDNYLGHRNNKPAPAPTPAPAQAAPKSAAAPAAPVPQNRPVATPTATPEPVDVEAVLTQIAATKGTPLNWRTSIVDLMKLLDLDSSLAERKELAAELGYTGAKDGSAEMNIWLHKAVMQQLEKTGGKVPAELKD
jgi:3-oxoacyl-ACP reductase-like protein